MPGHDGGPGFVADDVLRGRWPKAVDYLFRGDNRETNGLEVCDRVRLHADPCGVWNK